MVRAIITTNQPVSFGYFRQFGNVIYVSNYGNYVGIELESEDAMKYISQMPIVKSIRKSTEGTFNV